MTKLTNMLEGELGERERGWRNAIKVEDKGIRGNRKYKGREGVREERKTN